MTQIKKFILDHAVTILGRNIWGSKSKITFTPTKASGWYFKDDKTGSVVPLNRDNISSGKNNLYAMAGKAKLHVIEHIVPLRWFGLDNICLSGSSWPPVLTVEEIWHYLEAEKAILATSGCIENFPIIHCGVSTSNNIEKMRKTAIGIRVPFDKTGFDNMVIKIHIDYPQLGIREEEYSLKDFCNIAGSYPQGYPFYRYYVGKVWKFFGWPHFHKIVWPQQHLFNETLKLFADHAALDRFAALAAIDHQRLPSDFSLFSHCSGHKYDLEAIKKIVY